MPCLCNFMKFHFSKQYKYHESFTSVYNYFIFIYKIIILLLTVHLTLVNASISSDLTFTPIIILGQFRSGPMNLFLSIALSVIGLRRLFGAINGYLLSPLSFAIMFSIPVLTFTKPTLWHGGVRQRKSLRLTVHCFVYTRLQYRGKRPHHLQTGRPLVG